jgi:large subunit ribosomal protein L21
MKNGQRSAFTPMASPDKRRKQMYAIFKTGGKQYKVQAGDVLRVEKLGAEAGKQITFDTVLAISNDKELKTGTPYLDAATVTANVLSEGKADKIIVFKYKAKKDYRKKSGHRQPYTEIEIESFELDGAVVAKKEKKAAKKPAKKTDETDPAEAEAAAEDKTASEVTATEPAVADDAKTKKTAEPVAEEAVTAEEKPKAKKKPAAKKPAEEKAETSAEESTEEKPKAKRKPAAKKSADEKDAAPAQEAADAEEKPKPKKKPAAKKPAEEKAEAPAAETEKPVVETEAETAE